MPPPADVAGLTLHRREGDGVAGVDQWWRMTAGDSTLTAPAVIEPAKNRRGSPILLVIRGFPILTDSNVENTGTSIVTRSRIMRALRSPILLYIYVII